jgi:hypothetical protein
MGTMSDQPGKNTVNAQRSPFELCAALPKVEDHAARDQDVAGEFDAVRGLLSELLGSESVDCIPDEAQDPRLYYVKSAFAFEGETGS